jgi:hypothetical protein
VVCTIITTDMILALPFDGPDLAAAALVRAVEFSNVLEEDVIAVSIIPEGNTEYARKRDRTDETESVDHQMVVGRIHRQVTEIAPSAGFEHHTVDRYAPPGTIAGELRESRRRRRRLDAVHRQRERRPDRRRRRQRGRKGGRRRRLRRRHRPGNPGLAKAGKLKEASPYREPKSDFHLPG